VNHDRKDTQIVEMYFFMARSEQAPPPSAESRSSRYRQLYNAVHDRNNAKFRCFGCVHVRTATMAMGTYNLMLQTLGVVLLLAAVMQMKPESSSHWGPAWCGTGAADLDTPIWNETSGDWAVVEHLDDSNLAVDNDVYPTSHSPRLSVSALSQLQYVKDYTKNMSRCEFRR